MPRQYDIRQSHNKTRSNKWGQATKRDCLSRLEMPSSDISPKALVKGNVQRDLTGVKTRLKRSVLMNYIVAKLALSILKEHHHERSIKMVSASNNLIELGGGVNQILQTTGSVHLIPKKKHESAATS